MEQVYCFYCGRLMPADGTCGPHVCDDPYCQAIHADVQAVNAAQEPADG